MDNVPVSLNLFVGRKREIAAIQRLLSEQRLVTLTGPGGCGKTRLAVQTVTELRGAYRDGICFVELAALADADLVPGAIASLFGLREQVGAPVAALLRDYLQPRELLLILDNCEHLVEVCARLSVMLLEGCPDLRLLATSREPLGVPGERVWAVPPLTVPPPQPWQSPASEAEALLAYEQSEAVQLFEARARAAWHDFTLTRENAGWVAGICRRLDGMPLAIELAAARVRAFSVREISEHLNVDFHLLAQGPRTALPRQQTLQATLDWSHALLSPEERVVLRRLAIFMGGWTMGAAGEVAAVDLGPYQVTAALSNLVDKSLVVVDRSYGETRYRFLETIRVYAWEKLAQAGELGRLRERHLEYFLRWAEQGEAQMYGSAQHEWTGRFDAEHENIRAALRWSESAEDRAESALRLAGACVMFWNLRGYFREGRARLETALKSPGAQKPMLARARALHGAAQLAYAQSDFPATRSLTAESLALYRGLGAQGRAGAGWVLEMLGELATEVGEYELVPGLMEESLAIFRELEDKSGIAHVVLQFGWAAMRAGQYEPAAALMEEGLGLFRELENAYQLGLALAGLGELAIRRGEFDRAMNYLEESLVLRRDIGHPWGIATSLGSLGWVALLQRNFPRMRRLLGESMQIRQEIGEQGGVAWCLEKLAEAIYLQAQVLPAARRRQELRRAARVFGAAEALRAPIDSVIDPADRLAYEAVVKALQAALGEAAFAAAWAEGNAQPLQGMIEEALAPPRQHESLTNAQAAKARFGGLSGRERTVAALIAQGKTNREIAEIMIVGDKTVETYVTRILNKLNLQSRVQIATWALKAGLDAPGAGPSQFPQ